METKPPRRFRPEDVSPPPLLERGWTVTSLALDLAGSCNLACRYCAEASTQPRRPQMSEAVFGKAMAYLASESPPSVDVSVRLGSGEPLLANTLLRRLDELIRREGGRLDGHRTMVFLTTNGTLINQETAGWLAETGWLVKISLDGTKEVHDAWRVTPDGTGTYARVAVALAALLKRAPSRISVTSVLCHGADPAVVFDELSRLGARRIELVPVVHHNPDFLPDAHDIERYAAFVEDYVDRYLLAGDLPALVRLEKYVTRVMGYDTMRIPCGAGRSFLGVGPDGDFFPCFRFVGIGEYRLGSLNSGLDAGAVEAFRRGAGRGYDLREPCRRCWAAPLCGGPCFACTEMFGPGKGRPPSYQCGYYLADARAAVRLVQRLRRRDPSRLLRFLPGGAEFAKSLELSS